MKMIFSGEHWNIKKTTLRSLFYLTVLLLSSPLPAQTWEPTINEGKGFLLNMGYGIQLPGGDLADRFGLNFSIEGAGDFITENNWFFGIQGQYLFGSRVNEDVLAPLRTDEGFIIGNDRSPADIQLRQRGSYMGVRIGHLIGLSPTNARAGLRINIGGGLLQHRIRIQEDPARTVSQLTGDYQKGYDRLSNGPALHQYIGYQVLGRDGSVNFQAGFEFFQGFTQNRRSFNFDLGNSDSPSRVDLLIGFRLSWTLPFYSGRAEDIYY